MHAHLKRAVALAAVLVLAPSGIAIAESTDDGIAAEAALESLKSLAGTWAGEASHDGGEEMTTTHEFRVSAGGTVVMETMHPGSDHEMINMYFLDGEELMLTHYCAAGNQPQMKLDRSAASAGELPFVFVGGSNLDPATDTHIHSAVLRLADDGKLDATWSGYAAGEPAGDLRIVLERHQD